MNENSGESFSDKFDVTLILVLIRNCTTLKAPTEGWPNKNPSIHDVSVAAFVVRAREWRNNVIHYGMPKSINLTIFNDIWKQGVEIIKGLGYAYNSTKLKTILLDPKNALVSESLVICMESLKKKQDENVAATNQILDTNDEILKQLANITKDIQHIRRTTNPITIGGKKE